jgi:hypothetical protein
VHWKFRGRLAVSSAVAAAVGLTGLIGDLSDCVDLLVAVVFFFGIISAALTRFKLSLKLKLLLVKPLPSVVLEEGALVANRSSQLSGEC